ncbi:MAG: hypothetical protein O7D86_07330 [Proteobacteria bacterium]|nr:hypothetical protein [Pseudomonadota bacterium]
MFDGLWTVEFRSTQNMYGRGVVVISNDHILGGDDGYYYYGTCNITNNKINADLQITKYDPNSVSVFGPIDHYNLKINGDIDECKFRAEGTASLENSSESINIVGTKKENM